jgi:hypothetical protein
MNRLPTIDGADDRGDYGFEVGIFTGDEVIASVEFTGLALKAGQIFETGI